MKRGKNRVGRLAAELLSVAVAAGSIALTMAGISSLAAPSLNAAVSADNALAVALEYDADGAFILQDGINHGDDISVWLTGSRSNAAGLETAVHEETHSYAWNHGAFTRRGMSEAIYTGGAQAILVPQTSVFKTEEWANSLPSSLRTFRYDTYVAAGASASANQDGVYGLLNEFNAYSWGMNNQLGLFSYYQTGGQTLDNWLPFINACENNYQAFCEFRYWTLGYLAYAQQAHPQTWIQIMQNQDYINAYCYTERRFENLIALYKAARPATGLTFKDGHAVETRGWSSRWVDLMTTDETLLLAQINQPSLQAQEQYMFAHCTITLPVTQDVNP